MSNKTLHKMEAKHASSEDMAYARATQYSMDANDVRRHREYINQYNYNDPFREANNWALHPQSYHFGTGTRSPEQIGHMFSLLPQPVYMNGPVFAVHPALSPYVQFRPW